MWCLVLQVCSICTLAQEPKQQQDSSSCQKFTQEFFDWYAPLTQPRENTSVAAAQRKIRQHEPEVLDPKLLRALRADDEAQERAKGEIVGLDFDPFVGSQDPADHYETRKLSLEGNKCSVEVWRASPSDTAEKSDKPDVVAEVVRQNGHWRFVNFRYPQLNADLLNVLASLAKNRSQPAN